MVKTLSLIFVLGLMVSCASQEGKRDPSSVNKNIDDQHYFYAERFTHER